MSIDEKKRDIEIDPNKTGPVRHVSYEAAQAQAAAIGGDLLAEAEKAAELRHYDDEVAASLKTLEVLSTKGAQKVPREHAGAPTKIERLGAPDDADEAAASQALLDAVSESEAMRRREARQKPEREVKHSPTQPPPPFPPSARK